MRQLVWCVCVCVCVVKRTTAVRSHCSFGVVKLTALLDVGNLVAVVLGVSCLGSLQVNCRDWLLDFGFVTLHMVAELLRNDAA